MSSDNTNYTKSELLLRHLEEFLETPLRMVSWHKDRNELRIAFQKEKTND